MSGVLTTALAAYDLGINVIREKTDGSKRPVPVTGWGRLVDGKRRSGWHRFQTERPDRETVERWFADGHPGIGYVTGAISGNLEMLELEGRAVRAGLLQQLLAEAGRRGLSALLERISGGYTERTPSDGLHWLYLCETAPEPNQKLAQRPATADELAADPDTHSYVLIETRGEGGQTVAAPSNGSVHPAGKPWELIEGDVTKIITITEAERAELLDICRSFDLVSGDTVVIPPPSTTRTKANPWTATATIGESWMDAVVEHLNATKTVRGVLLDHGWTDGERDGYLCRPGKDHTSAEINGSGRLINYSTNAPFEVPLVGRKTPTYDVLDVIAVYEHGGDRQAAAKRIAEDTGILAAWKAQRDNLNLSSLVASHREPPANVDPDTGEIDVPSPLDGVDGVHYTDLGNADRLVDAHGDHLHYVPLWAKWLCFDGGRWRLDHGDTLVAHLAGRLGRPLLRQIAKVHGNDKAVSQLLAWVKRTESAAGIAATLTVAATRPGVAIDHEVLDADPWLLNVRNGTVDLRGDFRPHQATDLLTMRAAVDFDAGAIAVRWLEFLEQVLPSNDVRAFVQRLAGLALLGDQPEHILPILLGGGANGKSTLTKILATVLGDYAIVASRDVLLALKHDTHPTAKADLFRRRFAHSGELPPGAKLDEAQVKELTGGDRIKARRMREDFWEFDPSHLLWLHANHRPSIEGTDDGIWRRVLLIPFAVQIPVDERDPRLAEQIIANESAGVLNWMLEGLAEYRAIGLDVPAIVRSATDRYRAESDTVAAFLTESGLVIDTKESLPTADLLALHGEWFAANGPNEPEKGHYQRVVAALREHGAVSRQTKTRGRFWQGIGAS